MNLSAMIVPDAENAPVDGKAPDTFGSGAADGFQPRSPSWEDLRGKIFRVGKYNENSGDTQRHGYNF